MITLFGIKNCDTVKKARRWLEQASIEYRFHDFRTDGITPEQITHWIEDIGLDTLINKRSTTWKNLSDNDKNTLSEQTATELIMNNPTLIKRPVLEKGGQFTVGFKDANYQTLFGTSA